MTAISINFDALRDASSKASDVARQLNNYADSLNSSVERPLGRLTGGSTSNTSSASSIAAAKARDLRNRSDGYRRLSTAIQSFSDSASQVDIKVNRSITSVANGYAADLPFWGKVGRGLYNIFNGVLGATEVGSLLKQAVNWRVAGGELARTALKKAYNVFKHGPGRSILSLIIAGAGLFVAAATFVGTLPVSGVVAAIMAVAAGIALLKSGTDLVACLQSFREDCSNDESEPGYARYRGSGTTSSARTKMESTSRTAQNIASLFDAVGDVAGAVVSVGNLFKVKAPVIKGVSAPTYRKDALLVNLLEGLGLTAITEVDSNGVTQFVRKGSKIQFKWSNSYWSLLTLEELKKLPSECDSVKHTVEALGKVAKPVKNMTSSVQFLATGGQTTYKKISSEGTTSGKVWAFTSAVVKAESSVVTGITLPKIGVSVVDSAISLRKSIKSIGEALN